MYNAPEDASPFLRPQTQYSLVHQLKLSRWYKITFTDNGPKPKNSWTQRWTKGGMDQILSRIINHHTYHFIKYKGK